MMPYLNDAVDELKRVDHLIYVSLKYTRTVDVIRSVVERLINACDFIIDQVLDHAKEQKLITVIPKLPGLKCDLIKQTFAEDAELLAYIDFYLFLRKSMRVEYSSSTEYRRHVFMGITIDGQEHKINIDAVEEYYEKIKDFLKHVRKMVTGDSG